MQGNVSSEKDYIFCGGLLVPVENNCEEKKLRKSMGEKKCQKRIEKKVFSIIHFERKNFEEKKLWKKDFFFKLCEKKIEEKFCEENENKNLRGNLRHFYIYIYIFFFFILYSISQNVTIVPLF